MKKITTLLICLFSAITIFAQSPVITPIYELSLIKETKPVWMDGIKERNMAFFNGKIYIPSVSKGNQIYIIDAATGAKTDTIALPAETVFGGAVEVCGIQITPSGKILVANLTSDSKTDNFKVYALTAKSGAPGYDIATVIDWKNNLEEAKKLRCGDHFAAYGDLTTGSKGYIMTANTNDLRLVRWDINNGVVASEPAVITLDGVYPTHATPIIHYGPVIHPVDENSFILNSARMHPTLYNMSGITQNTFNGMVQPKMAGISGVTHFKFKNRSFVVCGTTSHQAANNPGPLNTFEVFEITGSEFNFSGAVSLGQLPAAGFGGSATDNPNSTYNIPIVYNVRENEVQFFVMVPSVALAAYKLTLGYPTSVYTPEAKENVIVYPVPATDYIRFSKEMRCVEIYNLTGQLVRKDFNTSKINVRGLNGSFILKAIDTNGQQINKTIVIK